MTFLQRVHYIWVRAGIVLLIASPIVMYLIFRAQGMPPDTFMTTPDVRVMESDAQIRFEPASSAPRAGWLLLPGCPADPRAYAPLARAVAQRGFLSVIVKVPYRCAPWPPHAAELRARVRAALDSCRDCQWALAGHSRGVRHALEIVRTRPAGEIESLILMASTHPREDDYSDLRMPVTKILGSEDGVAPLDASLANRRLLPAGTRFEVIDGGNHSQFAYYGFQLFDGRAGISRAEQHLRVAELVASLMRDLK